MKRGMLWIFLFFISGKMKISPPDAGRNYLSAGRISLLPIHLSQILLAPYQF